ncbi:glycosyltransferase family 2 protein [Pseudopedobacter beijingensis]|uniref:Glycosyltransferase family 2 protein n=1 Tax=Pseudopedobacter beijingensis TaxID=1207056 RepID=A0ABW4IAK8_9SPHI
MKILTIIVTYNATKNNWIYKCLSSVISSNINTNILVVDNNSTDHTVNFIKENFPQVSLVESKENLGFGKANNIGLRKCIDEYYDFAFLLNQDAFVLPHTIHQLAATLKKNKGYGILSPLQMNGEGRLIDKLFYKNIVNHPIGRSVFSDLVSKKNTDKIYDLTYMNAACWLIDRHCIEKIGFFDEIFDHYGEDNNYCHRLEYHNYKIGLITDTLVYHDREEREKNTWEGDSELKIKLKLTNILNKDIDKIYRSELIKKLRQSIKSIIKGNISYGIKDFINYYRLLHKIYPKAKASYLSNKNR